MHFHGDFVCHLLAVSSRASIRTLMGPKGPGACWRPILMKRRCYLTCGLMVLTKRLIAVAATRDLATQVFILPFSFGAILSGQGMSFPGKRSMAFATSPEMVQQNRQLAGHRDDRALFPTLAPAGC